MATDAGHAPARAQAGAVLGAIDLGEPFDKKLQVGATGGGAPRTPSTNCTCKGGLSSPFDQLRGDVEVTEIVDLDLRHQAAGGDAAGDLHRVLSLVDEDVVAKVDGSDVERRHVGSIGAL